MNMMLSIFRSNPYLAVLGLATCLIAGWRGVGLLDSSPDIDSTPSFKLLEPTTNSTRSEPSWEDVLAEDPFMRTAAHSLIDATPNAPVVEPDIQPYELQATPNLKLTGILTGKRSVAMINGQSLSVGMSIEGCEVLEIRPESVLIKYFNQRSILSLPRVFDASTPIE